eukprot:scaffold10610_cov84-Isochrysis_galbana.AAC.1
MTSFGSSGCASVASSRLEIGSHSVMTSGAYATASSEPSGEKAAATAADCRYKPTDRHDQPPISAPARSGGTCGVGAAPPCGTAKRPSVPPAIRAAGTASHSLNLASCAAVRASSRLGWKASAVSVPACGCGTRVTRVHAPSRSAHSLRQVCCRNSALARTSNVASSIPSGESAAWVTRGAEVPPAAAVPRYERIRESRCEPKAGSEPDRLDGVAAREATCAGRLAAIEHHRPEPCVGEQHVGAAQPVNDARHATGAELDELDGVIGAAQGEGGPVWGRGDAEQGRAEAGEEGTLGGVGLPEDEHALQAGRQHQRAVHREGERAQRLRVP